MPEWLKFVGLAVQISISLIVIAIGLHATWASATYLFRQPALLAKSILARNVAVPLAAVLLVSVFPLVPPVRVALLALSVTALPPFAPISEVTSGGRAQYVMGLLVSQSLLAVVFVPLSLEIFNLILGTDAHIPGRLVFPVVVKTILLPFGAGLVLRRLFGASSDRIARIMAIVAGITLALAMIPILVVSWRDVVSLLGNGTVVALTLLVLAGLLAGHFLGGPREQDRTVLALAAGSSHPMLAIATIKVVAPAHAKLATSAVLLYLVIGALAAIPYKKHRARARLAKPDQWRSGPDRREEERDERDRRRAVG